MFTGLVQAVGTVKSFAERTQGVRLVVDPGSWKYARQAKAGDSVSVSGCCLTLVRDPAKAKGLLEFDLVAETLLKTTFASNPVGSKVNLEHAATAATFMGGHIVQGHIDGIGGVNKVRKSAGDWRLWIGMGGAGGAGANVSEPNLWRYLMPKGSICVDGVSLTIAGLWAPDLSRSGKAGRGGAKKSAPARPTGFWVALIPETLERTTLKALEVGDWVNLEIDPIAKMVVRTAERMQPGGAPDVEIVTL